MRLIQIPFSHNCIKVRKALDLKGLRYDTLDIQPLDRSRVRAASGQALVPVLEDDGRAIADSTAILLHLEARYADPPLLPSDPAARAECLVLEDWADSALMALSRRLAYWHGIHTPGAVESLFLPGARGLRRIIGRRIAVRALSRRFRLSASRNRHDEAEVRRVAALAIARLGGREHLVGERTTIADVALAAMASPLLAAPAVLEDRAVRELAEWSARTLGEEYVRYYRL